MSRLSFAPMTQTGQGKANYFETRNELNWKNKWFNTKWTKPHVDAVGLSVQKMHLRISCPSLVPDSVYLHKTMVTRGIVDTASPVRDTNISLIKARWAVGTANH